MPLIRHPEYVANCIASGPGRSMQKLSAFKNCSSVNHFLFSTISRCINAIWAAGPPKDKSPILHQVGTHWRNFGLDCILIVTLRLRKLITH